MFPLQAKQRVEVLQATHKFFSEQQQIKADQLSKAARLEQGGKPPLDALAPNHHQAPLGPDPDKPPGSTSKPVRTGPIKPQAVKPEEGK